MRLESMSVGLVRKALHMYVERAFGPSNSGRMPQIDAVDEEPVSRHFDMFQEERPPGRTRCGYRLVIRLGNRRYPFMKFVLQEHLIEGEYFFSVDTHDEMFDEQGDDAEAIRDIKLFNRDLKSTIERSWQEVGLPTFSQLKGLVESMPVGREGDKAKSVLLVDDEDEIAETVELLMVAKGYHVDRARDGQEALETIDPTRHDLILLDNEMPGLSGLEVCEILKDRQDTRTIPILLATAGRIDIGQIHRAEGFLTKPFQSDILFSFVAHLLKLHPRPAPIPGDDGS